MGGGDVRVVFGVVFYEPRECVGLIKLILCQPEQCYQHSE